MKLIPNPAVRWMPDYPEIDAETGLPPGFRRMGPPITSEQREALQNAAEPNRCLSYSSNGARCTFDKEHPRPHSSATGRDTWTVTLGRPRT